MTADPPPISTLQPMTPPGFDRIVRKCLAKDPEDRWQSAADLGSELKWVSEGSQAAAPLPSISRSHTRGRLFLGIALLAAAAALALMVLRREPTRRSSKDPLHDSAAGRKYFRILHGGRSRRRLARWETSRFHSSIPGRSERSLGSRSRCAHSQSRPGYRGRGSSVLVTRFPIHRLLRGREAEAGGRLGRPFADPLRCALRLRRHVELRRSDPLQSGFEFSSHASRRLGRRAERGDDVSGRRDRPPMAVVPAGRPPLSAPRRKRKGPLDGGLPRNTRGEGKKLLTAAESGALYAPPGYLLFVREGALTAQAFDARSLQLTGEPIPVAERVGRMGGAGPTRYGPFSASSNGCSPTAPSRW